MTIRAYEQQQQPAESKKPTTKKKVEESDDMNVTSLSPEKEEDWCQWDLELTEVRKAVPRKRELKVARKNANVSLKIDKHKSPSGGLTAAGRRKYNAATGSNLKAPVTGKVKRGSKAAKRRKSFCARMSGVKGPMKKPNGKPTRKALALRKWKC